MQDPYDRRGPAPWTWILVLVGAILLIFVIWWAIAAQSPEETVVVPGDRDTTVEPPVVVPPAQQPVVVERERPVNIYVERDKPQPRVIVVPRNQEPPEARQNLRQLDLPGEFRYQGKTWQPSDEAVTKDGMELQDTGASIAGNTIYAEQGAATPYDELYVETEPGSGVYLKYEPSS